LEKEEDGTFGGAGGGNRSAGGNIAGRHFERGLCFWKRDEVLL
jgi:hypothetical protein